MAGDLQLTCSDCGREFTFTAADQTFFQERGYSTPKRCKPCRQAKKADQAGGGGGFGGGGSSYGGGGGGYSSTRNHRNSGCLFWLRPADHGSF
jgi:hypothetical protein